MGARKFEELHVLSNIVSVVEGSGKVMVKIILDNTKTIYND